MRGATRVTFAILAWLATVAAAGSCREEYLVAPDRNKAPESYITGAPRERGEAGVSVRFFWRGYDSDGTVTAYEFAIDDTTYGNWTRTTKTDSVFLFRVAPDDRDVPHTFYLVAVDNEGKRDPTAAFRTFTAVDRYPPLVDELWGTYVVPGQGLVRFDAGDTVLAPRRGETPYDLTFHWTGSDADGVIVRYFWHLGSNPDTTISYADTATVSVQSLAPKSAGDRSRYTLWVTTEDDAGLYGGEPPDGILPASMEFAVDFIPHTTLDSVRVFGTHAGFTWDPVPYAPVVTPPETLFFSADSLAEVGSITFPRQAILELYWHSQDPEEGCVDSVRWVGPGTMLNGREQSAWAGGTCLGNMSTGALRTDSLVAGPLAFPVTLRVRARDSWGRVEEPGAPLSFVTNYPPTVHADSVRYNPSTRDLTFRWSSSDRDDGPDEVKYQVSIDPPLGQRVTVTSEGNTHTFTASQYDTSQATHLFEIRAANDLQLGPYAVDTLPFAVDTLVIKVP